MPARDYGLVWKTVWICAALQTIYAAAFIWRSSFLVEGQRYFCLFDDAMISMRYADHWSRGLGPVWNERERVEGYTSFLWTGLLAGVHRLRLSPSHTCLAVQLLGLLPLWACLVGTARLARACRLLPASAVCAVLLVPFHYNLTYFSLMGMETACLCALLTFGLGDSVRAIRGRRGGLSSVRWYLPAVLTRFDALPVVAVALLFEFACARRARVRTLSSATVVTAALAALLFWRHSYYGEWWPNTYYLKLTGWPLWDRIQAGIQQTPWIGLSLGLPMLLAGPTLLAWRPRHLLLATAFATGLTYHVYAGGDAWPLNRFVIPTSCGLFVLAADGTRRLMHAILSPITWPKAVVARCAAVLACVVGLIGVHWDHALLLTPPQTIAENAMSIRLWRAVERISDPPATLAVGYAGVVPYFSRRRCHDLFGRCDAHIARLPVRPGDDRPGHNKYDVAYSLREHQPDIVLNTDLSEESPDYFPIRVEVGSRPVVLFVRRESPWIRRVFEISASVAREILQTQQSGLDGGSG